jgi:glutamate carboxypeptidase
MAREADCVLTMEPARINGNVVSARKGVLVYKITAHGREAHAGVNPDLGRNAIVALADRLLEVWKLNGYLPGLNVNPGLMSGGSAVNTVAGQATCGIDVRVARSADVELFDHQLRRRLEGSIIADVTFDAVNEHTMPPMEKTEASARLVALAQQAAGELGFELADTATGGGSDGAYAATTGTPVLDGLGPIGGYAHSEREFLDVGSVVPRTAMLGRLITLV